MAQRGRPRRKRRGEAACVTAPDRERHSPLFLRQALPTGGRPRPPRQRRREAPEASLRCGTDRPGQPVGRRRFLGVAARTASGRAGRLPARSRRLGFRSVAAPPAPRTRSRRKAAQRPVVKGCHGPRSCRCADCWPCGLPMTCSPAASDAGSLVTGHASVLVVVRAVLLAGSRRLTKADPPWRSGQACASACLARTGSAGRKPAATHLARSAILGSAEDWQAKILQQAARAAIWAREPGQLAGPAAHRRKGSQEWPRPLLTSH